MGRQCGEPARRCRPAERARRRGPAAHPLDSALTLSPACSRVAQVYALPGKARAAWRSYIGVPGQLLLLSTLSLLVGFYLAGASRRRQPPAAPVPAAPPRPARRRRQARSPPSLAPPAFGSLSLACRCC